MGLKTILPSSFFIIDLSFNQGFSIRDEESARVEGNFWEVVGKVPCGDFLVLKEKSLGKLEKFFHNKINLNINLMNFVKANGPALVM